MIERVLTTLHTLSTAATGNTTADMHALHDRIVNVGRDYADAYRLLADCPQVQLTTRQALALEKLDGLLTDLDGSEYGTTADFEAEAAEHARIAAAARSALATLVPHLTPHTR